MATNLVVTTQVVKQFLPVIQGVPDPRIVGASSGATSIRAVRPNKLFSEALLETSSPRTKPQTARVAMSMVFHTPVLLALLLPPLYFTDTIDMKGFAQTFLVAPPPPPPAAQSVVKVAPVRRVFTSAGKLLAPAAIPQKIAMLKEEPLAPDVGAGVAGGIAGGVPGGQLGGIIGGILSGASHANVPVPSSQPKAPIRVGGRVKAPRVVAPPAPVYPVLAQQTKLEGVVSLDAVIDTGGNVIEMRVISGPPLLIQAALDAVRNWKYEPTFLNDQAIAVQLIVTVKFRLQQ